MSIEDKILKLKQVTNAITHNPLLDCFEQDELKIIDNSALLDKFIADKKKKIFSLIDKLNIDFDSKLKSAFDEYIEAMTYLRLKAKFDNVERIKESNDKTPDFKIEFNQDFNNTFSNYCVYAELKTMSFAQANNNYIYAMNQGLNSNIEIEKQLKNGRKVAFGLTEIQPLYNSNKDYDPYSVKYAIEILIEKIEQNIKEGQFSKGETVLIIDLKQLILPSDFKEGGVPVSIENQYHSLVSGVHWNVAFGKIGYPIYRQVEFEGRENIEGELSKNGILISRDWIKAICFVDYEGKKPKITGFYRHIGLSNEIEYFLHKFCEFVNDDVNSNGWEIFK